MAGTAVNRRETTIDRFGAPLNTGGGLVKIVPANGGDDVIDITPPAVEYGMSRFDRALISQESKRGKILRIYKRIVCIYLLHQSPIKYKENHTIE